LRRHLNPAFWTIGCSRMISSATLAPVPEARTRRCHDRRLGGAFNIDWRRCGWHHNDRRNRAIEIRRMRPIGRWRVINRRRTKPYPYRRTVNVTVRTVVPRPMNGRHQRLVRNGIKPASGRLCHRAMCRGMRVGNRTRPQLRRPGRPSLSMSRQRASKSQHNPRACNLDRPSQSIQSSHLLVPTITPYCSKERCGRRPRIPFRLTVVTASYNIELAIDC
jgi:hypothetical protein